jgi:hypothetical protein
LHHSGLLAGGISFCARQTEDEPRITTATHSTRRNSGKRHVGGLSNEVKPTPFAKKNVDVFPRLYLGAGLHHGFGASTIAALKIANYNFAMSCCRSVYKIQHDMALCLWLDEGALTGSISKIG